MAGVVRKAGSWHGLCRGLSLAEGRPGWWAASWAGARCPAAAAPTLVEARQGAEGTGATAAFSTAASRPLQQLSSLKPMACNWVPGANGLLEAPAGLSVPLACGCHSRGRQAAGLQPKRGAAGASDFDLIEVDINMARIDSYLPGGFVVNNILMPGPVVLYSNLSLLWHSPSSVEQLRPEDMPLLDIVKPPPDLVIIGAGKSSAPLPQEIRSFLADRSMSVEVMDSMNASATFNILSQDGRPVAAFLFPLPSEHN
mmetsp:Transcript_38758/g.109603  ORF Transcript_38758/g.109603 Transcript_38758/m.109603 type:complete len:255 (-) Transcript_38758:58-822(-)